MRLATRSFASQRRGVAAVEFAVVLPLLLLLLVGIWELGRIIHVQLILNNATRDGARLAAQANIVASSGDYTQIHFNSGTPNVSDAIRTNLIAAGITNLNGLVIELEFVESATNGRRPVRRTRTPTWE